MSESLELFERRLAQVEEVFDAIDAGKDQTNMFVVMTHKERETIKSMVCANGPGLEQVLGVWARQLRSRGLPKELALALVAHALEHVYATVPTASPE